MVIAGAGGHASELLSCFWDELSQASLFFFDNQSGNKKAMNNYPVIATLAHLKEQLAVDPGFVLGTGSPSSRKKLWTLFMENGGRPVSLVSPTATIGSFAVALGDGLNIMPGAVITSRCTIGDGVLVHIHASVHHDTHIGDFCELSPGCRILGGVELEDGVSVGTGAILLPRVKIGSGAVIGAGAVVTKNVAANQVVAGVPARERQ